MVKTKRFFDLTMLKIIAIVAVNIVIIVLFCGFVSSIMNDSHASTSQNEKTYNDIWCATRGETEVVLSDRTRCDCITDTHAVEVDFGNKWAEAIGQSLHYSIMANKRAGIVLVMRSSEDVRYWIRLNNVIETHKLPIDTWSIGLP